MATIELRNLDPDIVVVALSGQLTMGPECQRLESQVDTLVRQQRTKVVLDMTALDYIDSAAIGAVALSFGKAKNAGGGLTVAGAHGSVEEVFHLTRISGIIPLYPDVPTAAAALSGGSPARA